MRTYSFTIYVSSVPTLDYHLKSVFPFVNALTYYSENKVLDVICSKSLSAAELKSMEDVILDFSDDEQLQNYIYLPQVISPITVSDTEYTTLFTWIYNGTLLEKKLAEVGFTSQLTEATPNENQDPNFNYQLRIVNNTSTLGEEVFSNMTLDYNKLIINQSNLPATTSTFQFQCKKNPSAGSNVTISSLQFVYQP